MGSSALCSSSTGHDRVRMPKMMKPRLLAMATTRNGMMVFMKKLTHTSSPATPAATYATI